MRKHPKAEVTIDATAYKALLLDVYKRQQIEACGLLLGITDQAGNWHIEDIHPMSLIIIMRTKDSSVLPSISRSKQIQRMLKLKNNMCCYILRQTGYFVVKSE